MNIPSELRYTKSHEWAKKDGCKLVVGISDYAQKEISDVVFVEVPTVGKACEKAKAIAVVESVKAAFDIYAPATGSVVATNTQLEEDPGLVNQAPYGEGWFFEMEISNEADWDELMTADQYEEFLKQGACE